MTDSDFNGYAPRRDRRKDAIFAPPEAPIAQMSNRDRAIRRSECAKLAAFVDHAVKDIEAEIARARHPLVKDVWESALREAKWLRLAVRHRQEELKDIFEDDR